MKSRVENIVREYNDLESYYNDIWGVGKLPYLVLVPTRQRYESCKKKLELAILKNDIEDIKVRVQVACRGLDTMHKQAIANGHGNDLPELWQYRLDENTVIGVVKDPGHKNKAKEIFSRITHIFTMQEVALILNAHQSYLSLKNTMKKANLENAEITNITDKKKEYLFDDPIPF
tara:strand:+ start:250 stop:771 length:522 start_codon:yes stop_codon:yes gene_type:complete